MGRAASGLWLVSAFSSAVLLFVAQPLLAKWLLPSFGGSASTWAACMSFFQLVLLAGYAYAWQLARLPLRAAVLVHAALVAGVIVFVLSAPPLQPIVPEARAPALEIVLWLARRAGLQYLLLSSTAPLLQAWAAQLGAAVPHRLYAVSNAGSLLGLLGYPWLWEAVLALPEQHRAWSWGSALFALLSLGCAVVAGRGARAPAGGARARESPRRALFWLACSFVPSVFLLAVTTHVTIDLAATPVLWVVPLAIYLITFIAAFAGIAERARAWLLVAWVLASLGLGYTSFAEGSARLAAQLGFALSAFGLAALLCHDALVRARPAPERLSAFYLWVAAGGALGGVYVNYIAPVCFRDYYELEWATLATLAVLAWARSPGGAERRWLWLGAGLILPLMAAAMSTRANAGHVLDRRRSFLGALRVVQVDVGRMLTHGRIRHGMQLSDPARARWPTMYFGAGTAVNHVLREHARGQARQLGVLGLGVGTLAALAGPNDRLRYFELDPEVVELASLHFTFLRDTPARVQMVLGDGRLNLERDADQAFDVLVLDAFSSDSVPAHLLTREAFEIYARKLAHGGVLLANVSNRHLAVDRVVRAAARAVGLHCVLVETEADRALFVSKVRWAVMMRDAEALQRELAGLEPAAFSGSEVLWTDARASLWSILK